MVLPWLCKGLLGFDMVCKVLLGFNMVLHGLLGSALFPVWECKGFIILQDFVRVCLVCVRFCKGLLGFGLVLQGFAWVCMVCTAWLCMVCLVLHGFAMALQGLDRF